MRQLNVFIKRVRALIQIPLAMKKMILFCSTLKKTKAPDTWTDTEITAAFEEWTNLNSSSADPVAVAEKVPKKEKAEKVNKSNPVSCQEFFGGNPTIPVNVKPKKPETENPVVQTLSLSIPQLQLQVSEARAKLTEVESIAETLESSAMKAQAKVDEAKVKVDLAMKVAADFQQKATSASDWASVARKKVEECKKILGEKTLLVEQAIVESQIVNEESLSSMAGPQGQGPQEPLEPLHIRRKKIPKHVKTLVWNQHIGPDTATADCVSCRKEKINIRNFHCGHVLAESRGGDVTTKNLRPICAACNGSMGTQSMNEFTQEWFGWVV
jgi:hypothetical protein